jgi:hypothetical protein
MTTPTNFRGHPLKYAAGWLRSRRITAWRCPVTSPHDLPERLQELLSYNIYPTFVGYVDGNYPRRVLSAGS